MFWKSHFIVLSHHFPEKSKPIVISFFEKLLLPQTPTKSMQTKAARVTIEIVFFAFSFFDKQNQKW